MLKLLPNIEKCNSENVLVIANKTIISWALLTYPNMISYPRYEMACHNQILKYVRR